jgi:hypothetical protein
VLVKGGKGSRIFRKAHRISETGQNKAGQALIRVILSSVVNLFPWFFH